MRSLNVGKVLGAVVALVFLICQEYGDSGYGAISHTGVSVSDVTICHCNSLILQKLSKTAAIKTWELDKRAGATYNGNEDDIILRIMEMEERDREIIYPIGVQKNCP